MWNFFHHTAEHRGIGALHHLVQFSQPQPLDDFLMFFRGANRAAHQFDSDLPFHHNFSSARPRISATAFFSRSDSSATMVAFTTLWGFRRPIDFVSTLGIPQA